MKNKHKQGAEEYTKGRREFLKRAGIAGAALALAPGVALARKGKKGEKGSEHFEYIHNDA
jgi:hypothetical protein